MERSFGIVILCILFHAACGLRFASYYLDQMVLQRAPASATVWGFNELLPVESYLDCVASDGKAIDKLKLSPRQTEEDVWQVKLPAFDAGTVCNIRISDGLETIELREVIFGDVWLCSGQSNMHFMMKEIINGTEEIEASIKYTDIRFMTASGVSPPPLVPDDTDDLRPMPYDMEAWYNSSNTDALGEYSAVCFLYARNIYDKLKIPIGLVKAEVGGTEIEPWSPSEALEHCGVNGQSPNCDVNSTSDAPNVWHCNSVLYNSKINPLKRMALKGFLWYQGESNTNYNTDSYGCTFSALIDSYRREFSLHSETGMFAPFGFVQLAANRPDFKSLNTPKIRWHQTSDMGVVPNDHLQNVFMAVALDTYDADAPTGTVHPRYKKIVAERLSLAGLNVAYGITKYPTNGPYIQSINLTPLMQNEGLVTITYDQSITYDDTEISGFYYCCTEYASCDDDNWIEINKLNEVGINYVSH
jgi:sialate O-acetylesterase